MVETLKKQRFCLIYHEKAMMRRFLYGGGRKERHGRKDMCNLWQKVFGS